MKAGLSFDKTALNYEALRPGYPDEMYADILSLTNFPVEGSILDIGSGTGQTAFPFIEAGYRVTCLEPGLNLMKILQKKTTSYPRTNCINSTFEAMEISERFDLIIAGTSFHWLDLQVSLPKIRKMLNPSGYLSLCWNTHPKPYTGFFKEVQKIYRKSFPPQPGSNFKALSDKKSEVIKVIKDSRLFSTIAHKTYAWSVVFSAGDYIKLLSTFSDNILLPESKRNKLFSEIEELIKSRYDDEVVRPYKTELYIFK